MSLEAYRDLLIDRIEQGFIDHEPRGALSEKNLLAVGAISKERVIQLLRMTKASQYRTDPHHRVARINVHFFEPVDGHGKRWLIKAYFIHPKAWFISVHPKKG